MASEIDLAFQVLKQAYGSHSAAAIELGITPYHYRAIRNGRVPIPRRTSDLIILKAEQLIREKADVSCELHENCAAVSV